MPASHVRTRPVQAPCRNTHTTITPYSSYIHNKIDLPPHTHTTGRVVAEFHDISDVRRVFETNLFGLMDITQLALPLLRQSKGRIVMISSLAGSVGK